MTQLELFGGAYHRAPAYPQLPGQAVASDLTRMLARIASIRAFPLTTRWLARELGVLESYVEGVLVELEEHAMVVRLDYQPPGPPGTPREIVWVCPEDADYWRRASDAHDEQNAKYAPLVSAA